MKRRIVEPGRELGVGETILTLGYQQRSLKEFVALARECGVDVLIDVRETAWSHKPGFSKGALENALAEAGIEYVHAPFTGNPKWLRENAATHAECLDWYAWYLDEFREVLEGFELLVGEILNEGKSLALTCFERHADDCHRSILAGRWAARGALRKVAHIGTDGCPRMLPT